MESEIVIWRPILEGIVSLEAVKKGEVDIIDLLKINALLDMKAAMEKREANKARGNS